MAHWLEFRDDYMNELLRGDGLGPFSSPPACEDCREGSGCVRCLDCWGEELLCESCIRKDHKKLPCHRVQVSHLRL